jgi:hypothetical protein
MTTATRQATETTHAERNGRGWIDDISANHEAWEFCTEQGRTLYKLEGRNLSREARAVLHQHGFDGDNHQDVADDIEQTMREGVLDVQVRSGWQASDEHLEAAQFQILLTTGGPALRLIGDLEDGEPSRSWFEIQDWGTPWFGLHCQHSYEIQAKDWFARLFFFG